MIKFSCEKVFLQNAIAVTSRAVAQKSSIPALEGLLIHADQQLTISGYNMQTGIRTNVFANVVEGGDIVLNARLFGDIIRRLPEGYDTVLSDTGGALSAGQRQLLCIARVILTFWACPLRITRICRRLRMNMPFPCSRRCCGA